MKYKEPYIEVIELQETIITLSSTEGEPDDDFIDLGNSINFNSN